MSWTTSSAGLHRQAVRRLVGQLRQPLSAAVGPIFAISNGLVDAGARIPQNGIATIRIWQVNIQKTIIAHVPITNGAVQETVATLNSMA